MTNRGFTEAVPLSLSSMAHMSIPLEQGVLDGIREVSQHTLFCCLNYARVAIPPPSSNGASTAGVGNNRTRPHPWTFRDLTTSPDAWKGHEGISPPPDLPWALSKLQFKFQYQRNAFIFLKMSPTDTTSTQFKEQDLQQQNKDWTEVPQILGRVSLLYATKEKLTLEELIGTEENKDETPKCVLYKVVVEYRSIPPTGKKSAVQAEELSMLSFGGSVDDDVKYGALASLYDEHAKYILEIYSVRGKKYKFDLMDSTLSDGTVPNLPTRYQDFPNASSSTKSSAADSGGGGGGGGDNGATTNGTTTTTTPDDPSLKSLCVTVTDHVATDTAPTPTPTPPKKYAVTRIHLSMDGNLRRNKDFSLLPDFHYISTHIQNSFLSMNAKPPDMATSATSGNTLLLDPCQAGKIYVNGRYVTTWGLDEKIGSHFPALFGMDLHSVPYWHGRILDYNYLKQEYSQLWQHILCDARLTPLNIGGRLLFRLMSGQDPISNDDDDDDDDDNMKEEDDDDADDDDNHGANKKKIGFGEPSMDCLESHVMQSIKFDPVGISAKALATRFKEEFGEDGFPCLMHEMGWVKYQLPGRTPIPVPQRVINVLRRGGYFDTQRTADEIWFSEEREATPDSIEQELVKRAIEILSQSGCDDVKEDRIVFFSAELWSMKRLVRFNRTLRKYHVNELFLTMDLDSSNDDDDDDDNDDEGDVDEKDKENNDTNKKKDDEAKDKEARAFLLGLYIAQEHPNEEVLTRYLLRNRKD